MSEAKRLTKEQAAIIGAFTGIACGPFRDIHEYAERKLGRSVWSHQFAVRLFMDELKEAAREDFLALAYADEDAADPDQFEHVEGPF